MSSKTIKLTEEQLLELLRQAWWEGHNESKYSPNPSGAAKVSARSILNDLQEEV
ncbi:hypothetical protein pEp_SNUABM04_00030 [Erwinia phage pEp_SNUABM_04]|nr:hypothetical protein pEp_SNUABM04_00030 [Erwinia phage pEp_SNUABM_04]